MWRRKENKKKERNGNDGERREQNVEEKEK
jgi:hypothetical protein